MPHACSAYRMSWVFEIEDHFYLSLHRKHGSYQNYNYDGQTSSPLLRNISRHGRHYPQNHADNHLLTLKKTVFKVLPHGYALIGSLHFIIHHRLPILQTPLSMSLRVEHSSSPIDRLSPLSLLLILILSFLTFICHARINPCGPHPWGAVHRHGPLVYVSPDVRNTSSGVRT